MTIIAARLRGHRLVLAEITYFMPDHPGLVQEFWRQFDDLPPRFPALNRFLIWWDDALDAKIKGVRVSVRGLIQDAELNVVAGEYRL